MTPAIDNIFSTTFASSSWSFATEAPRDVIVELSEALGPIWSVCRESDCEGDVSIIVLPLDDDAAPTFVLYEKRGVACVATVSGDDWDGVQGFAGLQEAVAAIIAAASAVNTNRRGDFPIQSFWLHVPAETDLNGPA
jgi:hypothetical protein